MAVLVGLNGADSGWGLRGKVFSVYQVHSAATLHLSPSVMVTECYFDWWD